MKIENFTLIIFIDSPFILSRHRIESISFVRPSHVPMCFKKVMYQNVESLKGSCDVEVGSLKFVWKGLCGSWKFVQFSDIWSCGRFYLGRCAASIYQNLLLINNNN